MKIPISNLKIAHRGLHDETVPENSILAFKKCLEEGIPIELDVHLIKGGNLVVFHDDNLKRLTGIDKKIKNLSREELASIKLSNSNEQIPFLDEVLKLVDGKVLLDIEIKTDKGSFKICKRVAEMFDIYNGPFMVKSFNPLYVAWFRFLRPNYQRGLLASKLTSSSLPAVIKWLLYEMAFNFLCKPDFLAISKDDYSSKKIEKLNKKYPILLWVTEDDDPIFDGVIFERKM